MPEFFPVPMLIVFDWIVLLWPKLRDDVPVEPVPPDVLVPTFIAVTVKAFDFASFKVPVTTAFATVDSPIDKLPFVAPVNVSEKLDKPDISRLDTSLVPLVSVPLVAEATRKILVDPVDDILIKPCPLMAAEVVRAEPDVTGPTFNSVPLVDPLVIVSVAPLDICVVWVFDEEPVLVKFKAVIVKFWSTVFVTAEVDDPPVPASNAAVSAVPGVPFAPAPPVPQFEFVAFVPDDQFVSVALFAPVQDTVAARAEVPISDVTTAAAAARTVGITLATVDFRSVETV